MKYKIHLISRNCSPYHLAFGIYGDFKTKCGMDANKVMWKNTAYPGERICQRYIGKIK